MCGDRDYVMSMAFHCVGRTLLAYNLVLIVSNGYKDTSTATPATPPDTSDTKNEGCPSIRLSDKPQHTGIVILPRTPPLSDPDVTIGGKPHNK
jgi:hypothetical protein